MTLRDVFYFVEVTDIANYADDTKPYNVNLTQELVINDLEETSSILLKWFNNNYMKVNSDKSHLLRSGNKAITNIDNNRIESEDTHELLGITTISKRTFKTQINELCKKASQKLNALARISNSVTFDKRKIIMKAFITLHFSYCRLVWMFYRKRLDKKINELQGRALRITHHI